MGKSREIQTDNIRIGQRFVELLSAELLQAASYASRGETDKAFACWAQAQLMLDTFAKETGINDTPEPVPAPVAAESKPAPKRKRSPKKASSGGSKDQRSSDDVEGTDEG